MFVVQKVCAYRSFASQAARKASNCGCTALMDVSRDALSPWRYHSQNGRQGEVPKLTTTHRLPIHRQNHHLDWQVFRSLVPL